VADLSVTLRALNDLALGCVSLTATLDVATATGRAMAALLAVVAEFEREWLARAGARRDRPGEVRGPPPRLAADGSAMGRGGTSVKGQVGELR
jgi:DNA invertase Pin-like site-specific DNA recombinase